MIVMLGARKSDVGDNDRDIVPPLACSLRVDSLAGDDDDGGGVGDGGDGGGVGECSDG